MEETTDIVLQVDRTGLISVPLMNRPKAEEIRPYLRSFQAHIMESALLLLDSIGERSANSIDGSLARDLRRLVTALSTQLEHVRIPIVWAQYKALLHAEPDLQERMLDDVFDSYRDLIWTTGVFLSHFDLARHLSEAETRVAKGDDKIDEALFIELDELVKDFDRSRAGIFANEIERANRIRAVLDLPSGSIPKFTVFAYRVADSLAGYFSVFSRKLFPYFGAGLVAGLVSNLPSVKAAFNALLRVFGGP